jgi:Flp pilus assembly protein TadB
LLLLILLLCVVVGVLVVVVVVVVVVGEAGVATVSHHVGVGVCRCVGSPGYSTRLHRFCFFRHLSLAVDAEARKANNQPKLLSLYSMWMST